VIIITGEDKKLWPNEEGNTKFRLKVLWDKHSLGGGRDEEAQTKSKPIRGGLTRKQTTKGEKLGHGSSVSCCFVHAARNRKKRGEQNVKKEVNPM